MPPAPADADLWSRLRHGGLSLLMRHASTEAGQGDPPGYRLEDCSSQRNLSTAGRDEARHVGERLRRERVAIERVYTSPWCRCRETGTIAFGKAEDWEPLSSIFDFPDREADYSERVKKRIANLSRRPLGRPAIHQLQDRGAAVGVAVELAQRLEASEKIRRALGPPSRSVRQSAATSSSPALLCSPNCRTGHGP